MFSTEICKNVGKMQIGCRGLLNLLVCVILPQMHPATQWDACASLPVWPGGLQSPLRQGLRRGKCGGSLLNPLLGFFFFILFTFEMKPENIKMEKCLFDSLLEESELISL